MNRFFKGVLLGVGIGLLVAPMRGEEMRRLLAERAQELRNYLPENEQLSQYSSQMGNRVSRTADILKDYAQQAVSNVKQSSQKLVRQTEEAGATVRQSAQDVVATAKHAAKAAKASATNP